MNSAVQELRQAEELAEIFMIARQIVPESIQNIIELRYNQVEEKEDE